MGYNSLSELFTATADAIRAKTGSADPIVANDFPAAIEGISGGGGEDAGWIGDGNTHIWISLPEGRTTPKLCLCVNGTVAVDWGDGTEPDTLSGANINQEVYVTHEYGKAGNYVITLSVSGAAKIPGANAFKMITPGAPSSGARPTHIYTASIRKVELGQNIALETKSFYACKGLGRACLPTELTEIPGDLFYNCTNLVEVSIPAGVKTISSSAFSYCSLLSYLAVPAGVTAIPSNMASYCSGLTRVAILGDVQSIAASAFMTTTGAVYFDFTNCTTVPTLANTNAFSGISSDCEFRVPAALVDEWKAATNWSTYADYIVGV